MNDMSLVKRLVFGTDKMPNFLEIACHQNVTTDANFAEISGVHGPPFGGKTRFSGFKSEFSMAVAKKGE